MTDIDGTLLNKDGAISDEDKRALDRVVKLGIRVSLSTGRVPVSCQGIIKWLSLNGHHMFCDGALVSNVENGEEVYVWPLDDDVVERLVNFAHRNGINLDLYSADHFFAERETWATDIRRQFFRLEPTIVDFSEIVHKERIIKGTLVVSSAEEKARAKSFYHQFRSSLNFSWTKTPAYPEVDFINVISAGVSKGKALEALASHLGIELAEVIAFGDGSNDVSMLTRAGMAIAMADAPDELKAVADYITLDVEHSGVSAAIDKFLLSQDGD
ncbi:MAG: HAD family phosphatase [Chloroflexi bacterium]|nr:HAD family phosphatase [Chloroflexota bacterium]